MGLIVLIEFGGVIATLVFRNDLWKSYESGFQEVFHHAYSNHQNYTIKIIEDVERQFKCCGVNGPSDYPIDGYKIPRACYPKRGPLKELPYTDGCARAVANWVWNQLPIIAGSLGAILFIEIFGIISSIVLGVAISHSMSSPYIESYRKF